MRRHLTSLIVALALITLLTACCALAALPAAPESGGDPSSSPGDRVPSSPSPTATDPALTATPSVAPYATPTAAPVPSWVPPSEKRRRVVTRESASTPERRKITETDHFVFYRRGGVFPAAVPDLAEVSELLFHNVSHRLEIRSGAQMPVIFRPPSSQPCPPRGLAGSHPPRIFIYADDGTSREQVLGVLAHELGHVLIGERYGEVPRALNEGLATWASASYFNKWLGNASLDAAVRSYVQEGRYLPLYQNYYLTDINPGNEATASERCIARRETLYIEWASFLGYLLRTHGMDKVQELIRSVPEPEMTGAGIVTRPADFEGVYGSSLNQLEEAWLREIFAQRSSARGASTQDQPSAPGS